MGGGEYKTIGISDYQATSALYDPETDSWTDVGYFEFVESKHNFLSPLGKTYGRWGKNSFLTLALSSWKETSSTLGYQDLPSHGKMFWTGSHLLLWGFSQGTLVTYTSKDGTTWAPLQAMNPPSALKDGVASACSDAGDLFLWGGSTSQNSLSKQAYLLRDSATSWTECSTLQAPSPRHHSHVVWAGDRWIVWEGRSSITLDTSADDGAEYFPETDTWSPLPTEGSPAGVSGLFWTGKYVIFWGEAGNRKLYDPKARSWRNMSSCGEPASSSPAVQWTRSGLVVWGDSPPDGGKIFRLDKEE